MNILGFEISRKNRGGTNIVSPHGRNVGGRIAYPNKQGYLSNVNEGYNKNPIVAACIGLYMSTLNEPPLVALNDDGELQPSHPLTLLFKSPNTRMGQAQFWQMVWNLVYGLNRKWLILTQIYSAHTLNGCYKFKAICSRWGAINMCLI